MAPARRILRLPSPKDDASFWKVTLKNKKTLKGNTGVLLTSSTLFSKLPKYLQGRILKLISGEHEIIGIGHYDGIQKYYHTSFARNRLPFLNKDIRKFALETLKVLPFYNQQQIPSYCHVSSKIYFNRKHDILWITDPESTYPTLKRYTNQWPSNTGFLADERLAIPVELWYQKPVSPKFQPSVLLSESINLKEIFLVVKAETMRDGDRPMFVAPTEPAPNNLGPGDGHLKARYIGGYEERVGIEWLLMRNRWCPLKKKDSCPKIRFLEVVRAPL